MFNNIEMMQRAQAMARHASERQTLVARNVANADTPGYRAQDIPGFAETLRATRTATTLRVTRAGHLDDGMNVTGGRAATRGKDEASPNGNTVSLGNEMVKAAEVRQQHDMAMAIYGKARDILRTSLGRGQ